MARGHKAQDAMPGGPGTAELYTPALLAAMEAEDRSLAKYAEAYMNNLNSVLIEGNMVRNPLIRATPKGTSVCNFTIASNRYYKQGQDPNFEKEVGFFDVETWGKLAEICSNQGKKGRGVRVVGRLKQDRWTGNDGKNHAKVAIVAEHVEYRPEFKKADDSASDANSLAESASIEEYAESAEDQSVFAGEPAEDISDQFRSVTF